MKRLILALALFALAPSAVQALTARTTNFVITITWLWVPYPGQNPPGEWVPIAVDPYVPGY